MLKLMIAASALAFVPTVAAHANPPSGDPPGCAVGQGGDVDNDPTGNGCPGQGGNGGNGGNGGGGGQGGGGGDGGHSDVDVSVAVANANTNTNTNQQQQGQLQGQLQGQQQSIGDTTATGGNAASSATGGTASVAGSGNSENNNSNSSTVTVEGDKTIIQGRRIPVATAYAAPLTSGNDVCMGSVSAGGQALTVGFSFAKTYIDKGCTHLKLARELKNQGFGVEACYLLKQTEPEVAAAFLASGRTCENATMVVNVVEPTPTVPVAQPAYAPSPVQPPFTGERGK